MKKIRIIVEISKTMSLVLNNPAEVQWEVAECRPAKFIFSKSVSKSASFFKRKYKETNQKVAE